MRLGIAPPPASRLGVAARLDAQVALVGFELGGVLADRAEQLAQRRLAQRSAARLRAHPAAALARGGAPSRQRERWRGGDHGDRYRY